MDFRLNLGRRIENQNPDNNRKKDSAKNEEPSRDIFKEGVMSFDELFSFSTKGKGSNANPAAVESFDDVFKEMSEKVPDSTSTIEEKELAISYINRMLACKDIPNPEYWENKKDVIEMEIQSIKNEQQTGKDSNYQDAAKEYRDFVQDNWCDNYPQERNGKLEFLDSEEYGLTFYNTCFSFLNRILACDDLPDDERAHFEQELNHLNAEKQSRLAEINGYKQDNNMKIESFNDVLKEFGNNVPDSTSTVSEKRLAAAYIKRMLSCDDITPELKNYWSNKKDIIEMEITSLENKNSIQNSDEKVSYRDVQEEFNEFVDKYNKDYLEFENPEDGFEYWTNYHNTCQAFIQKLLNCSDLPDKLKTEYRNEYSNHQVDINNIADDLKRYKSENSDII